MELADVPLSGLYEELDRRRASKCKACDENRELRQQIAHLKSAAYDHAGQLLHIQGLLDASAVAAANSIPAGHITPGQLKVLEAAKNANLYHVATSRPKESEEGFSYTHGTGWDFALVDGFPCWHLTCPVAQAEHERRVTEEGTRS